MDRYRVAAGQMIPIKGRGDVARYGSRIVTKKSGRRICTIGSSGVITQPVFGRNRSNGKPGGPGRGEVSPRRIMSRPWICIAPEKRGWRGGLLM